MSTRDLIRGSTIASSIPINCYVVTTRSVTQITEGQSDQSPMMVGDDTGEVRLRTPQPLDPSSYRGFRRTPNPEVEWGANES